MTRTKVVKDVDPIQMAKRANKCEEGFPCPILGCEREVCRPRKFIEHLKLYHQEDRRWWCSLCSKFFQLHSCEFWHQQVQYKPSTYVTIPFDESKGDKCEEIFLVKEERVKKRKMAELGGNPLGREGRQAKLSRLLLLSRVLLPETLSDLLLTSCWQT
jgi:hypothetical protein